MPKLSRKEYVLLDWLATELDAAVGNWMTCERKRKEFQAMIKERRDRASRNKDWMSRANENGANLTLMELLDSVREWQTKAQVLANVIQAKKGVLEMTQGGVWEPPELNPEGRRTL